MIGIEVILIFILVSIITYFIVSYSTTKRIRKLAEKLPGDKEISLLESLKILLTLPREEYINKVMSYALDEYPMTKVWFLNKLMIVTKDADFINKVYMLPETHNKPDLIYKGFITTKGIITLAGSEHKRRRNVLNKAFSSIMLQRLPEVFDEKSRKIIGNLKEVEDSGEFNILEYIGPYSLESFGKSNLNYEIDYFRSNIISAYERYSSVSVDYLPFAMAGIRKRKLLPKKLADRIDDVFTKFYNYFDEVVKFNKENKEKNTTKNFIGILLDPKNDFNHAEIRDQLIMATMGAYETSARTISMVLMMLGIHKDVQRKLLKEIDDVFSAEGKNAKFSVDFILKFKYLEMVLKETMRLFAIVPMVARETSKDVDINGYMVPKNTIIIISIFAMQRDEKYWGKDALLFKPERFENGIEHRRAWAPFSGGTRICIGYRFSLMGIKVFLINFLRNYTVNCSQKLEEIKPEMTMTLNFLTGYKISIQKRKSDHQENAK